MSESSFGALISAAIIVAGGGTTFWIDTATRAVLKYDVREGPATIEFRR